MIKIYHNPRCRKSREGLQLLKAENLDFEIIDYLKEPLTERQLSSLIQKLGISAEELVRKEERIWKDNYKGKMLSDDEIVTAMANNPKLIQRPIVENGDKAVVGRPTNAILDVIHS